MSDAISTPLLTPSQHLRLELLKLVNRPDRDAPTLIDKAKQLEAFVLEAAPVEADPKKRPGNGKPSSSVT